ncbi:hypothetical protein [Lysobacter sp. ESA13C]|uniref:hypothetical protein n=1 Tax=Lysobacter sp. ESA13C TaxID=2862676 RepID=UPI001CBD9EA6|nr:hypothetical protein [Lysobacter sp. ESA13C]
MPRIVPLLAARSDSTPLLCSFREGFLQRIATSGRTWPHFADFLHSTVPASSNHRFIRI